MQFTWKVYEDSDNDLVNSWLDDCAIKEKGIDDGWQDLFLFQNILMVML